MLFVSIIGMGLPAGKPYCPDAYRGGGGRTLGRGRQSAVAGRHDESQPQAAAAAIFHFIFCVSYNMVAAGWWLPALLGQLWGGGLGIRWSWWAEGAAGGCHSVPRSIISGGLQVKEQSFGHGDPRAMAATCG